MTLNRLAVASVLRFVDGVEGVDAESPEQTFCYGARTSGRSPWGETPPSPIHVCSREGLHSSKPLELVLSTERVATRLRRTKE